MQYRIVTDKERNLALWLSSFKLLTCVYIHMYNMYMYGNPLPNHLAYNLFSIAVATTVKASIKVIVHYSGTSINWSPRREGSRARGEIALYRLSYEMWNCKPYASTKSPTKPVVSGRPGDLRHTVSVARSPLCGYEAWSQIETSADLSCHTHACTVLCSYVFAYVCVRVKCVWHACDTSLIL